MVEPVFHEEHEIEFEQIDPIEAVLYNQEEEEFEDISIAPKEIYAMTKN